MLGYNWKCGNVPEAKKAAKKILSGIGKGLKAVGHGINTDIKRYQETQRNQRMQRQIDDENYRQNYIAGKAYGSGLEDGRQEAMQRARNRSAMQRNQDEFDIPSNLTQDADDFYTRDLYPRKRKKRFDY